MKRCIVILNVAIFVLISIYIIIRSDYKESGATTIVACECTVNHEHSIGLFSVNNVPNYCTYCGRHLTEDNLYALVNATCYNCGASVESNYCKQCGTKNNSAHKYIPIKSFRYNSILLLNAMYKIQDGLLTVIAMGITINILLLYSILKKAIKDKEREGMLA